MGEGKFCEKNQFRRMKQSEKTVENKNYTEKKRGKNIRNN